MRTFLLWGWAVIRHWIAILGGAAVSVGLLVWAYYGPDGTRLPSMVWWTGLTGGFVIACYLAWRDENVTATQLLTAARPKLTLVHGPGQNYDSLHHEGRLRIFRVGVLNSGEPVHNVSVKLFRVHPELPRVFPMQEFQHMHEVGCSRFTVNKSAEPLVFVDVIYQYIHDADGTSGGTRSNGENWQKAYRKGETHQLTVKFANAERINI